ncbi:ABC transporter permease [Thermococcus sp. M39]|uniref:fluoroquinolone export ABC transporter permease subunit n=1 Tax=unclassified Thermococcus TaxID=2627626 RepID=UPI00143ABE8F|nr:MULTISPECIES: ABC transporter permease [unclassified Thermococcus]NJE07451.1 ABC transporter permease [Thermococcus sp. M39]NJE12417.1 ABC transporter permease [Thermococcus sp. LS2]
MTFVQLMKVDLKVGVRNYSYPIYLLAALAYGLMLKAFPENYHTSVAPLLIFIEPALLGFMFVGTAIFADKKDGTISALSVTPMEWRYYYLSKTLIMALLGVVGAFLIVFVGTGVSVNMSYVLTGTFLCSVVYTLLGIAISAKYRDLDDYFVSILAVMVVSLLPFAHYHGLIRGSWAKVLYAIPSYPALYFLQAGFEPVSRDTLMWSGFALIIWSGIVYHLAKLRFYRYAVEGLR